MSSAVSNTRTTTSSSRSSSGSGGDDGSSNSSSGGGGNSRWGEEVEIPVDKIEFSYSRSSGPGGQNVNKVRRWGISHYKVKCAGSGHR